MTSQKKLLIVVRALEWVASPAAQYWELWQIQAAVQRELDRIK